jgi:hypothetical protein
MNIKLSELEALQALGYTEADELAGGVGATVGVTMFCALSATGTLTSTASIENTRTLRM